jgi:hypothetical protein
MKTKFLSIAFLATLFLAGCEQTFNDPLLTEKGNGLLVVKITDAPFPADLVEKAMVTIDWIKLKKADVIDDANGDNPESYFVIFEKDTTINLLELNNGITKILSKLEIPVGVYSEIRLHVVESSLKLFDDDTVYKLKIPSGESSGIKVKINPALEVKEGSESELLFDFDVSRSFKIIGNDKGKKGIKGFMFKPVVRAAGNAHCGRIEGVITGADSYKIKNAWVTLLSGKDTIASSKSTENGFYAIIGVPEGNYDVECAKEGYVTEKVSAVSITAGNTTKQNFILNKE